MKLVFVYYAYENQGSSLDLQGYARAAREMGHEVIVYGVANAKIPLDYSIDLSGADAVVFVFEWTTDLLYGDRLDWLRLVSSVPRSRRVIIDCDRRLAGLFKRSFPEATVHGTRWEKELDWPEADRNVDASISAFEVLKHFRTKDSDFPGTPYLKACPTRTAMWKHHHGGKPTIGIAWTGGTWKNAGSFRNMPLKEWQPIFDAVDANWVSLQYKDASKDIEGTPVVQYHFATLTKDYDDTAALVASCDLVIGVQTSVNHLAGALGVPNWIVLPTTSQWRYGESYSDLTWYKSSRLYRKEASWPVHTMASDLKAFFK